MFLFLSRLIIYQFVFAILSCIFKSTPQFKSTKHLTLISRSFIITFKYQNFPVAMVEWNSFFFSVSAPWLLVFMLKILPSGQTLIWRNIGRWLAFHLHIALPPKLKIQDILNVLNFKVLKQTYIWLDGIISSACSSACNKVHLFDACSSCYRNNWY